MPTDALTLIDIGLRFAALGVMFVNLLVIGLSRAQPAFKIAFLFLFLGGIEYLTATSPLLDMLTQNYRPYLHFLGFYAPLGFWVFALYLFEEKLSYRVLAVMLGLFSVNWLLVVVGPGGPGIYYLVYRVLTFVLVMHIFYLALSGRRDDLIEKRRRIRLWLAFYMGILVIVLMSTEYLLEFVIESPTRPLRYAITATGAALVSAVLSAVVLLRTDRRLMIEPIASNIVPPADKGLSPSETVLHDKLNAAMDDGYYRTHVLSISQLAEHLETPEHRLRALINGRLGYRNFSSFLNSYRIAEAKEKLADPDSVDLPVLTIAMDLGYGSLTPFNRAFRAETGQTPREFRKSNIGQN